MRGCTRPRCIARWWRSSGAASSARAEPADQREAFLSLKPRGRAVYEDLVPTALAFRGAPHEDLSPEDRDALERILDGLGAKAAQLGVADTRGDET